MTGNVTALLAANLAFLAAGLGLTRALGLWVSARGALSWAAVAYMAGAGAVGIAAELALVAGLELTRGQVLAGCVLLAALGLLRRRAGSDHVERTRERAAWPLKAAVGVLLGLLLVESSFQALDTWDSWAMWTMKARALVVLHGLDPDLFANSAYAGAHLDYPLLLPALQAIDFRAMEALDTQVIHMQSALLLIGWLLASARLLRGRADELTIWAGLGLAVVAPASITLIQAGYADVPGAVFMALACLCAWLYLEQPQWRWAGLLAVFATAGASTKREAWTFALGLFLLTLLFAARRRRPLPPPLAGLATFALTIGAWLGWLAHHGITGHDDEPLSKTFDISYLTGRIDRVGKAVVSLASYSGTPSLWLIAVPLTLVAAAIALRSGRGRGVALFLLPLLAIQYAALVWAFWISRAPIDWHLTHASPRVVSTPVFVAASFLPLLIAAQRRGDEPV